MGYTRNKDPQLPQPLPDDECAVLPEQGTSFPRNRPLFLKQLQARTMSAIQATPKGIKKYSWTTRGFSAYLYSYLISNWIKEFSGETMVLKEGYSSGFYIRPNEMVNCPLGDHMMVFTWKNSLYQFIVADQETVTVSGADVSEIVKEINAYIDKNNFYRGQLLEITEDRGDITIIPKDLPKVTFEQVILPDTLKSDIYDNTVFHMTQLEGSNGVIFYGDPGVGKSHICKAISYEVSQHGITSLVLANSVDFSVLQSFINLIGPCVVFLEDADSFAISRESAVGNRQLSDFLQFVNGIADHKQKLLFIATTNHLKMLDSAISNRPMRFNRKFEFQRPSDEEIEALVKLYFGETVNAKLCFKKDFTGSHIREVRRTCDMLMKKHSYTMEESYERAIALVSENFSPTIMPFGFGKE